MTPHPNPPYGQPDHKIYVLGRVTYWTYLEHLESQDSLEHLESMEHLENLEHLEQLVQTLLENIIQIGM